MNPTPYQVMPPLAADEFEALKADIAARGVQVPVEYDEMGNILDGHHRVQACYELGVTHWPRLVRHGMSEQEKRRHARRLNLDRRHLNSEQKRGLISQELKENPGISDRAIGAGLNVDHKTVGAVREIMETTGEIPQLEERQGRDNRTRRITQFVPAEPAAPHSPAMPSGGLAIAHQRDTSDEDPREFFPTPPWATRALIERVLVHLNRRGHCGLQKVWEPACGEGHMAEPLKEYFRAVFASDKYRYGYAAAHIDFLEFDQPISTDWIITNPPFRQSTAFVQKALKIAGTGVAMFVRLAWIEGVARYEQLLRDNPPSLLSIFTERVPLHKGRWEPDGGTFTAYAWLVWIKGMPPQPPFWIPPGCRKELFKADDVERFGKIAEADEAA